MSFNLDDYIDVAERHRLFLERFPEGRLQSEVIEITDTRVVVKAYAYRDADDTHPGIGHSMLAIPGATPYTKGSELENAETSAWGRAIVACGFETKKMASADEVRNKTGEPVPRGAQPGPEQPNAAAQAAARAQAAQAATGEVPTEDGDPRNVLVHFGKRAGTRLGDLPKRSLEWYATVWEAKPPYDFNAQDRRLKLAAQMILGLAPEEIPAPVLDDDDIRF